MRFAVIVPASFTPAREYKDLSHGLKQYGINSVIVDLPSVGRRGSKPGTMTDDTKEISRVVTYLSDQGAEVVLVMHSYSGIPGTQSIATLSHQARSAAGRTGGISKLVYMSAVILQIGMSNFDLLGSNVPQFITIDGDYMKLDLAVSAAVTFSDLPVDQQLERGAGMVEQSVASFEECLTYAGYNDLPVEYIVCEEDQLFPKDFQYEMIEVIQRASTRAVRIHKLRSGHAPHISQPDNLSLLLKDIVES